MPSYVVTGASRGLGYAWVTHLASTSGSTVIAIVRNKSATEARLANDNISNIHVLAADVTDHTALKLAAAATADITGGSLDILIHNAALVSTRNITLEPHEVPPQEFEEDLPGSFQANVVGTAHAFFTFLPLIRKGEGKKMIVTSSGMADEKLVVDLDLALAAPYHRAAIGKTGGILVLALCSGLVDTQEGKPMSEEDIKFQHIIGGKFAAPGFTGPISPLESVEGQLKMIERATVDDFGRKFISRFGNKTWN